MAAASGEKKSSAGGKTSAKKGGYGIADKIRSLTGDVRKNVSKRIEKPGRAAKVQTAELAVSLVKLQRSAFDKVLKVATKVQERADKAVKDRVQEAEWMPNEGKDIVKEWSRTLEDGRAEFQKTVDKSYDLLRGYFERVAKEQKTSGKKSPAAEVKAPVKKKPAAKKKGAKRKAAPVKESSEL